MDREYEVTKKKTPPAFCLGDKISSAHTGLTYEVSELGIMYPEQTPTPALYAGQVGYVVLGMKTVRDANIGDTFHPHSTPLSQIKLFPNFEPAKSKVFSGLYPMDGNEYHKLQDALDRLTL